MTHKQRLIGERERAIRAVKDITRERNIKGNAHVTAGRYGELVANMVRAAESQMALDLLNREEQRSIETGSSELDEHSMSGIQHVEPESLRGQNVINPT